MNHLFIINPVAGKGTHAQATIATIKAVMEQHQLSYEIQVTKAIGHATTLAQEAAQKGNPLRVYACGGDGTLSECAAGLAGYSNAALTHFPTGSGNDFLRMFGEDKELFSNLSNLLDPETVSLDMMDCNGQPVLNVCSVGLDARIGIGMTRFKSLPLVSGSMAYQLSVLREVIMGIHQPYEVAIDGVPVAGNRFTMICVCNGQYYGGGFHPSLTASPNDGMLECIVIDKVSRFKVASLIGGYAKGQGERHPEIHIFTGRTITIRCQKENMVNIDGECLIAKDITISLSAKQLNFFYPKKARWEALCPHQPQTTLA